MSDGPSDDEFVEIHVEAPAAADPITPEPDAEAAADADAVAAAGDDALEGEKPEASNADAKGEDGKPLRDEGGRFKGGAEARIAELTRHRREAERSAEYWKGIATRNSAQSGDDAAPASKPQANDFEDYGDFVEALTDWKVADRARQSAHANAEAANKAVDTSRAAEWEARIGATKATIADFDAVMDKADTPTAPHVADAIMDADRGPELLYHLAGHPEIVERLNEMSPNRAAMELGRIEATLAAPVSATTPPPAPRETTQTKAPAPITPVASGSTTAKDPSKMSMDEYKAYRKEQGIR